jgi:hypothetical protein
MREIQPAANARYVDDFLPFHQDRAFLDGARARIEARLEELRLRLHDGKSRVYRTADGVTFHGWRMLPDRRRLVRRNVIGFRHRIRAF